ncbi:hypothetical protein ACQ4LE_009304 [Meloidogyne hapla]
MEKIVFLQVFTLSIMNSIGCTLYIIIEEIIVEKWMAVLAQFIWFHVHGFPPIIYLTLNKSIRDDCRSLFYKIFKSNKVQQVSGITTILVKPGVVIN